MTVRSSYHHGQNLPEGSNMFKKILIGLMILVCILQPVPAFAHGGGGRGLAIASLAIGSAALLYCAGQYYRYTPAGYVMAVPPAGAVYPAVPAGYTLVYPNGYGYPSYYYPSAYYAPAPAYAAPAAVQPAPAAVPQTPVQQVSDPAVQPVSDVFEISLPNRDGTFTHVSLRKTEKGFLGPQGEFYSDHPTEEELRTRYAKPS
jgi:hypothetical protein